MFTKYLYPNYKINRDENIDEEADGIIFKNGIVSLKSSFLLDYMVNPGNRKNGPKGDCPWQADAAA